MCKGNIRENFALSEDIKQAVNELYSTDVNTIRNLSDLAKKLQQGGLTIPGNVIINQDLTASGDFKANKKADITGNLTTNGDFKAIKNAEITGNLTTNGDLKASKNAEITGNLKVNNICIGNTCIDENKLFDLTNTQTDIHNLGNVGGITDMFGKRTVNIKFKTPFRSGIPKVSVYPTRISTNLNSPVQYLITITNITKDDFTFEFSFPVPGPLTLVNIQVGWIATI
jgi:hypothetical protein